MIWLRRLFWLTALGAAGFATWSWWQRSRTSTPADAPEWPPLRSTDPADPTVPAPDTSAGSTDEIVAEVTDEIADEIAAEVADEAPAFTMSMSDHFRGEPPAEPVEGRWVRPIDGECPDGYPVKANGTSMIYHVPGGRFYARTIPERCYSSPDLAAADGYRAAKA